jgi:hypothetical protein
MGRGPAVYYSPNGLSMGRLLSGTTVIVLQGPVTVTNSAWYQVYDPATWLTGWLKASDLALP